MNQNLSSYKIFYTVATCGNISQAANKLYISQPAVSRAIQKLEENLNVKLFLRNSRGVSLTDEGTILMKHLLVAFDSIDIAEKTLNNQTSLGVGKIRIGVSTTLCKHLLLFHLKDFITMYPHIKITIDCQTTYQTLNLLEENKIDIGLVSRPNNIKHFHFKPLGKIEDIFVSTKTYLDNLQVRVSNANNNYMDKKVYDVTDILNTANLMLLDKGNITREYVNNYLKTYNIKNDNILEINDMDLLIEFAKIGLGVACVIKSFVLNELDSKELIEIPFEHKFETREIGLIFSKYVNTSSSIKNFINFFDSELFL